MSESVVPSQAGRKSSVFITPFSAESLYYRQGSGAAPASAAYISTQTALYFPFSLPEKTLISRFFWVNGTTASTNYLQVGVYNASGNSIALGTGGSPNYGTLAAGASQPQFDDVTDFWLSADKMYYMAIWCGGTTTHLVRNTPTARFGRSAGLYQQTSLTTGLPTTATFAVSTLSYIPIFGLTVRASP